MARSGEGSHLPLSERLGEECWLFGVLTEGPTGAPRNSFSRDESPLPWRREQISGKVWAGASTVYKLIFKKLQLTITSIYHIATYKVGRTGVPYLVSQRPGAQWCP